MGDGKREWSMRVGVFHPGTQHSYRTALAFQRAAMLDWYATQIYFDSTRPSYRGLELLPAVIYKRIARELERRFDPDLDGRLVRTQGYWEWINAARAKFGWHGIGPWVLHRRNLGFARFVARLVENEPVDLLWGYDSKSLGAFEGLRGTQTVRVLEQTIGHSASWNRILAEERERVGPSIDPSALPVPDKLLEELGAEHALADRIACGSTFVFDTLVENGVPAEKLTIVPYGVDVERFAPRRFRKPGKPFRLLFVGTFGLRKGAHDLLAAMKSLGSDFHLTVVGHQRLDPSALVDTQDLVEFVPHVPRGRIHEYYSRGDVFVLPSIFEGSSLVLYEALAAGLPVVTTPHAGSVIEDGKEGFIVPIREPDILADRVRQLAGDPDRLASMREEARKTAERFTWDSYGERISTLAERWAEPAGERS
jgi:glycosyltransferase involved in cell wall biosynthesis